MSGRRVSERVVQDNPARSIFPVFLKIEDFETLRAGWCYGEGMQFSKQSVDSARRVALSLLRQGFEQLDAFPGMNGEIRVTAYDGDSYFEFTIDPDDAVTFVCERNGTAMGV